MRHKIKPGSKWELNYSTPKEWYRKVLGVNKTSVTFEARFKNTDLLKVSIGGQKMFTQNKITFLQRSIPYEK